MEVWGWDVISIFGIVSLCLVLVFVLVGAVYWIHTRTTQSVFNTEYAKQVNGFVYAEIPHAFTDAECDTLMQDCERRGMSSSLVINETNGNYDKDANQRNSKTTWLHDTEHELAAKMSILCERLTGIPRTNQEKLQVVCYDVGGKFNTHFDAQYNSGAATRVITCLVYLNDDFEGGETEFVNVGVRIKPEKGKMLVFRSLDGDGKIDKQSAHCGHAVVGGHKWICTKWVHTRPY